MHFRLAEEDQRAPYLQLADALRREMSGPGGQLTPGTKLPSSRQLQARFGVASSTVQNALRVLRTERLIYSVQGRGSFVSEVSRRDRSTEAGAASPVAANSTAGALAEVVEMVAALRSDLEGLRAEVAAMRRHDPGG